VRRLLVVAMLMGVDGCGRGEGQKPPLLPEKDVAALANELSGRRRSEIWRGLRGSTGSAVAGFHSAASWWRSGRGRMG